DLHQLTAQSSEALVVLHLLARSVQLRPQPQVLGAALPALSRIPQVLRPVARMLLVRTHNWLSHTCGSALKSSQVENPPAAPIREKPPDGAAPTVAGSAIWTRSWLSNLTAMQASDYIVSMHFFQTS